MSRDFVVKLTIPPRMTRFVTNLGTPSKMMSHAYESPPQWSHYCLHN